MLCHFCLLTAFCIQPVLGNLCAVNPPAPAPSVEPSTPKMYALQSFSSEQDSPRTPEAKQLPVWYNCCRKAGMNGTQGKKTTRGQRIYIRRHDIYIQTQALLLIKRGTENLRDVYFCSRKETYTRMKTICSRYLERKHALGNDRSLFPTSFLHKHGGFHLCSGCCGIKQQKM